MTGTIIENLSGRKLAVLVTILLLCQVTCFLIGGLVAPTPTTGQNILGTVCKDKTTMKNDTTKWFYNRGKGSCKTVDLDNVHRDKTDVVFAFEMPPPRDRNILDFSRWQQNLIGVLQVELKYHSQMEIKPGSTITIDAQLAYKNKGDDAWKFYTQSVEKRRLDCDIYVECEKHFYNCSVIPLFEMGSLCHDFYLLNVRLPVVTPTMNINIGHIQNLWLTVINQNGGFTKVWLSLKTIFFPCIIGILTWFWNRLHVLQRKPLLLEKMLLSLGVALCLLNMPFEYLTLNYDLPFMLLLSDIKQVVFYVMLFSFWLIFAVEHMLIQDASEQSSLKHYRRHLCAVATGSILLFIFDICERGAHLRNAFYSIWVTDLGTTLALIFIILAGILTGVYFLFLCYMAWQVFTIIPQKRQSLLTMFSVRNMHLEGIIYHFKFFMLATLLCASLTVIGFILGQVAEDEWKWDETIELEYTSAFSTGIYGMWNIYIFALLILYAPSNKRSLVNENTPDKQHLSEDF